MPISNTVSATHFEGFKAPLNNIVQENIDSRFGKILSKKIVFQFNSFTQKYR